MRVEIRPEAAEDVIGITQVHDAAFGRPIEGRLVAALRERARPFVGLVAVEGGAVVGHIAFSPVTLHCYQAPFTLLSLGPMAVHPAAQRTGIGSALVREGLARCRHIGHDVVVVLGHPAFYPRFGFVPARPRGVMCEYPVPDEVFMLAELTGGALRNRRGVVLYPPEFREAAG